jgi:hypothetical protein
MAISCPGLITRDQCGLLHPSRFKPSRSGYTGAPAVKAIVLHLLHGVGDEQFDNSLTSPLPQFQCITTFVPACDYPLSAATTNPKSVHFLVTQTGTIQYAEITDTTLGIDYIDGTWPGLPALFPITDVNGPFIHIAVSAACLNSGNLVQLLCCIGIAVGSSLPIIASSDLQKSRPELIVNPTIQTSVDNCVASGGVDVNPPTVADLQDEIEVLQQCCADNTSDIINLQTDLTLLTGRVSSIEGKVTALETQMANVLVAIAVIPALQAQVVTLINQVADILVRCCPQPADNQCFRYQLLPGDEMIVTANQPVWLNLPTRIVDVAVADGGPLVLPGPLWMAKLLDCTWSLNAIVRFRLAQWCSGKKASLYLVACGVKYLIAEQTITSSQQQNVTLTGSFLLPGGCTDVHLLVADSDDKVTTAHVVEFAEFSGCCA